MKEETCAVKSARTNTPPGPWVPFVGGLVLLGIVYFVLPADFDQLALFVLVAVTMLYALFTQQMVVEMRTARELQVRPCVLVDFEFPRGWLMEVVVKNIGDGPARDVRFRFDHPLLNSQGQDFSEYPLFHESIEFLPPHKEIRAAFDSATKYFGKKAQLPLKIIGRISYADATGQRHDDPLVIDLSIYKNLSFFGHKDMNDLVKEVEELKRAISQMKAFGGGLLIKTPRDLATEEAAALKRIKAQRSKPEL